MLKSPILIGFIAILSVFAVIDLLIPVKAFSVFENRYLAQRPSFDFEAVLEGDYMKDFESYINDQFVLRNQWINLKSVSERILLKKENNDILFGKHRYLFDKVFEVPSTTELHLKYLEEFLVMYAEQPVTSVIVPNSFSVLNHLTPSGAPFIDQTGLINEWNAQYGLLDVSSTLLNHKDESIYFRSDHHWTLFGAYLAYREIVESWNLEPVDFETLPVQSVDGFYGTYYNRSKPVFYPSERLYYYEPDILWYDVFGTLHDSIIDHDAFEINDKYRAFLHGNIGFSRIVTQQVDDPQKILIIKDSYANSMVPFFTTHFDQIDVIDLRQFSGSIKQLIETESYDQILFLQNFMQFTQDRTIARLRY